MITGLPESTKYILASRSPRRQQLLREAGIDFTVRYHDHDETYPPGLSGREIAEYLSAAKAEMFREDGLKDNEIVITADTIVWCNGKVLDKPSDGQEALEIIRTISGNSHDVITGVTLLSSKKEVTFSETTLVYFSWLSDDEIRFYIDKYKPFDKAGAYGIQEWIGIVGNSRIEGSYFNVMGLPVQRLIAELRKFSAT